MSIATKTGDDGTTALLFGRRVSKTDARVVANGAIDELNAALGTVRATIADPFINEKILAIQRELVVLMGELAVLPEDRARYVAGGFQFIETTAVDRLTAHIDDLEKKSSDQLRRLGDAWSESRIGGARRGADRVPPGRTRGGKAAGNRRRIEPGDRALPQPPFRPLLALGALE
jgi:hypothetical protein